MSKDDDRTKETQEIRPGRRGFLTSAGVAIGGTAVFAGAGLVGCGEESETGGGETTGETPDTPSTGGAEAGAAHVAPGQLDDYYGFWSGGQSGEVRVMGIPSMRELKRIPVFNRESATGWGRTDWSKQALGGRESGDTHHVHLSYDEGTYDGRYAFVNDKASARLARIRLDTFEVDHDCRPARTRAGTHGIFPQRHKHRPGACATASTASPMPNDGLEDGGPVQGVRRACTPPSTARPWRSSGRFMVEGNMDLCATDYEGNYSFAVLLQLRGRGHARADDGADQDCLYVFNIPKRSRPPSRLERRSPSADSEVRR